MKPAAWVQPLLLAVVLTGLNAAKPLHIDDTQYFQYAAHIAAHPFDPYGFEVLWFQWAEPAIELLNPLGLPYWLAGGMALFGEDPTVAKLTLFPFLLLFTLGVSGLLRRFVRVHEVALLWMVGLSPAVLPGINLMLDLPALAWVLGALNLFFSACDARSPARAALAGVITGIAMQTKYSALVGPGVMLLYALVRGQLPLGLLAGAMAAVVFGGVEAAVFARYGRSHFLIQLMIDDPFQRDTPKLAMLLPLWTNAGAVACTAALLGLAGLARRASPLVPALAAAILGVHALLWVGPAGLPLFALLGLFVWAVAWTVARRVLRNGERTSEIPGWRGAAPDAQFLVAWLALELVAYFVLAPFPAARRMTVLFLLMVLLGGRLLARGTAPPQRTAVLATAALSGVLGLVYFGVDVVEARAAREVVERASHRIREEAPDSAIWFVGHWGFQHYAERAGMTPVEPDHSLLRAGDWLLVNTQVPRQALAADPERLVPGEPVVIDDSIPLGTVPDYYSGVWPLHHRDRPRAKVLVLRATADVVPRSGLPPQAVIDWARERGGTTALAAVPALLDILRSGNAAHSRAAGDTLRAMTDVLRAAAREQADPERALAARRALSALRTLPESG